MVIVEKFIIPESRYIYLCEIYSTLFKHISQHPFDVKLEINTNVICENMNPLLLASFGVVRDFSWGPAD